MATYQSQHKLVCLYDIRQSLEYVSAGDLVKVVEFMILNNHQSTIISGIFRQLYWEGETNSKQFLNDLRNYCITLPKSKTDVSDNMMDNNNNNNNNSKNGNNNNCEYKPFDIIPDSLHIEIGKYLSTNEILSSFQRINRNFFRIGNKPEIIKEIEINDKLVSSEFETTDNKPKFKFDSFLSKTKSLTFGGDVDIDDETNQSHFDISAISSLNQLNSYCSLDGGIKGEIQHKLSDVMSNSKLKRISIAGRYIIRNLISSYGSTLLQLIDIPMTDKDSDNQLISDYYHSFYQNIKQIHLTNVSFLGEAFNLHDIECLLDMIVPLCPKEYDLKYQLNHEMTNDIKGKLTSYEIELIENRIKSQIHDKYNNNNNNNNNNETFDENELTVKNKNENKHKNDNKNSDNPIEMILFAGCDEESNPPYDYDNGMTLDVNGLVNDKLTSHRIKQCFTNLKALGLLDLETDDNVNLSTKIGIKLINNLCNQLTSLHINNSLQGLDKWIFVQNNYPCTKESLTKSWFPANIEELCLKSETYTNDTSHLWHHINDKTFPKLKKLKIQCVMNKSNQTVIQDMCNKKTQQVKNNLKSLIVNGLTSLEIIFTNMTCKDILSDFNPKYINENERESISIIKILNLFSEILNIDNYRRGRNKIGKKFIFKISFEFDQLKHIDDALYPWPTTQLIDGLTKCDKIDNKNYFNKLANCLSELYSSLNYNRDNIMFGFKLIFPNNYNDEPQLHFRLSFMSSPFVFSWQQFRDNNIIFKNGCGRVVDTNVITNSENLVFGTIMKNFNNGENNISCQDCHMDPIFEYQCDCCKTTPWLS